jgi:sterol desaturase/sphingolipid hydroxylase (fatty acid hydroxylase superfamily)
MYIHPLEACGYYCILYSPSAIFPMRPITFFVYMALLGFAGVLDHSGIRVRIPGVSSFACWLMRVR